MSLRPTLGLCIGVLAASFAVTGCVSEWHVGDDGYDEEGLPPCDEPPPPEDGCDSCSGCGSCSGGDGRRGRRRRRGDERRQRRCAQSRRRIRSVRTNNACDATHEAAGGFVSL